MLDVGFTSKSSTEQGGMAMDKSERKHNEMTRESERRVVEHRQRLEAAKAAEARRAQESIKSKQEVLDRSPQSEKEINLELERRQAEAAREWHRAKPRDKSEFALEVGQIEHKDWEAEIRRVENAKGRIEGKDYAIEYELEHPDGGKVRYDYVDFREHRIVDRKAEAIAETDGELVKKYEEQRRRHVEAYKARFGRTPTYYEYSSYPSTKDLFKPAD
jgi:hypothetical protein